jgi:short-subunit dehydrogenase
MLIIGATSAIAQATAQVFVERQQQNLALFLVARDAQKLQVIAADLKVRGATQVDFAVLDVNDFEQHQVVVQQAIQKLGGVDTVLIAHGSLDAQPDCEQNYQHAEQCFRTNFLSVVSLLTPLANEMELQRYGCIAVISSVAGDRGRQSNYVYGAAKGALNVFLQGLRNRLHRSHVCVLTIKPGFVDTPMTAHLKKGALWAQPATIAEGIYQAIQKRKNEVYLPWFWRGIMTVIKTIPEPLFKRLKM